MKIKKQKTEDVKRRKKYTKVVKKMLGVDKLKEDLYEEEIGVIGVDSGQIIVCDPCYIDSSWEKEEYDEDNAKYNFSYNACCKKQMGQLNFDAGHAGVAVVTPSGFGDGLYPVIATIDKNSGRVKSLRVEFF